MESSRNFSHRKGGAFVVDYARVEGWTKRSRLPGGKSSVFDMEKLFIPINQGNVHWVLVVVDMDTAGGEKVVVSFFDSFGKDGTTYVEASSIFYFLFCYLCFCCGKEASCSSPRWPGRPGENCAPTPIESYP